MADEYFRTHCIKVVDSALSKWLVQGEYRQLLSALRLYLPTMPDVELERFKTFMPARGHDQSEEPTMAKKKPAGAHADLHAYPADPTAGLDTLLAKVRGEEIDMGELTHAAWHVQGYIQSQFDPHEPAPVGAAEGLTLESGLQKMKDCCEGGGKKAAISDIPWKPLLAMLLAALADWLNEN